MRQCFEAVTSHPANIMGLDRFGIAPGKEASFVLLQARSAAEALRLRATRLRVYRRGRLLAQTPASTTRLDLPGRPAETSRIAQDRTGAL